MMRGNELREVSFRNMVEHVGDDYGYARIA